MSNKVESLEDWDKEHLRRRVDGVETIENLMDKGVDSTEEMVGAAITAEGKVIENLCSFPLRQSLDERPLPIQLSEWYKELLKASGQASDARCNYMEHDTPQALTQAVEAEIKLISVFAKRPRQ